MSNQKYHGHASSEKNLQNTIFYLPGGIINEEIIHEAAQRHLNMLRDFVPEETLQEMQQGLNYCLPREDWLSATFCLSTYLGMAAKWLEDYVFRLASDKQAIRCYAERIALLLDEE